LTELAPERRDFFLKSANRLGVGRLPGSRRRRQESRHADRDEFPRAIHVGTGYWFHAFILVCGFQSAQMRERAEKREGLSGAGGGFGRDQAGRD